MQRELTAIKHGVAQLREATLDEATLEEPEVTQPPERVVFADRDQCAKIAKLIWRHGPALPQPSRQVANQMQGLLVGDLGASVKVAVAPPPRAPGWHKYLVV